LTVPARTCGVELAARSIIMSICPANKSCIPGPLPRYGTNWKRVPVAFWKKTPATCDAPPAPAVACVAVWGRAFSHAIKSIKSFGGRVFFPITSSGWAATNDTGSKSFCGSYGSAKMAAFRTCVGQLPRMSV
jgi:hypothetical protein